MDETKSVLDEVSTERERQETKWGEQNHHPLLWLSILGEEYGEVCKEINDALFTGELTKEKLVNYRMELIQVAAVAVAAIESLDRNKKDSK